MRYQPERPIHLGITGVACTGKTTLANALAPQVRIVMDGDELGGIWWEHVSIGAPFHEMAAVLQTIEGEQREERVRYALHAILAELVNPANSVNVTYDDLVDLVRDLSAWNLSGTKPRAFMQWASSRVRFMDPGCLITSTIRRMRVAEARFRTQQEADEEAGRESPVFGIVVSDVRIQDQYDMIRAQPNNLMIRLTAPPSVLEERRVDLGYERGLEDHDTESWPATAPDELFDAGYDTSAVSVPELRDEVHGLVAKLVTT